MISVYLINIGVLAFYNSLKDIIAFLPVYLLTVSLSVKDDFHRDGVKGLTFAPFYEMGTLFARERHRFPIFYKMRHFVMYYLQLQKYDYFLNSKSFDNF